MSKKKNSKSQASGDSFVWLTSLGLTMGLVMVSAILIFILVKGLAAFWPSDLAMVTLKEDSSARINNSAFFAGEEIETIEKTVEKADGVREQVIEKKYYVANRDIYKFSFVYVEENDIEKVEYPENIMIVERLDENRGIIIPKKIVFEDGREIKYEDTSFRDELDKLHAKYTKLHEEMYVIQRGEIRPVTKAYKNLQVDQYKHLEALRNNNETLKAIENYKTFVQRINENFNGYLALSKEEREKHSSITIKSFLDKLLVEEKLLNEKGGDHFAKYQALQMQISDLQLQERELTLKTQTMTKDLHKVKLHFETASGHTGIITVGDIIHYLFPNQLSTSGKLGMYFTNVWRFLSENPRRASTEGGVFPAIVGTLVMTILMCIFVTPFGVIAAIFLHEYAKQGPVVRVVRIAINNLAGVPSIVYGAFGMAFFIYYVGGSIDQLFYSDRVKSGVGAMFGTGGMMWASLTLALLTVPVVIVATEEALAAVPRGIREGAFGCGASKWQMIKTVVLPASAPGIITGMILAMARGAGEVAPLMLVGVADSATEMSLESSFPFGLEKKFLHLGYNIYHVGFKATDSEAAQPLVFATTLLLITIVAILNLTGIIIRQHLRKKYASGAF